MRLLWTRRAHSDRREIRRYVALDNPAAALALDELITAQSQSLIDHPNLGRPGLVAGTREVVMHRNYILVYDMDQDVVRILRILHAAQEWPPGSAR